METSKECLGFFQVDKLNKNFLRNNFSAYCCVFFHWLTLAQNTILRQRMQVEFNASHI